MQFSTSYKNILKIAAPISVSLLIPQVSFFANAVFLSAKGQTELVVNGLTSIYYLLLTYIGFGLSNGIMVMLSRRLGANDVQGFSQVLRNGFFLCLFFSLSLMLLSFWFTPIIFGYNLKDDNLFYLTIDFLYLRIWGLPFLLLTQLINAFYIATSRTSYLIFGALLSNMVVVFLDYVLIFGHWGFPQLGLKGAAIASISAEFVYMATMYALFFAKSLHVKYAVFKQFLLDYPLLLKITKVSSPLIVQYIFSIGGWQIFYFYVEHLGITELATSHILRSVLGIVSIGTWALAATCNSMVSGLMGSQQQQQILPLVKRIVTISFMYTLCIALVLFIFPNKFLSLYTSSESILQMGAPTLRILACSVLVMSVATILFNAVVGTGNTVVNLIIEVVCVVIYVVYITIVVEQMRMSLPWAWASELAYWGLLLLFSGYYLTKGKWQHKKV